MGAGGGSEVRDRLVIRDGDADTAVIAQYEATRREAVGRGLIAGGGLLGATMVATLLGVRNAFAQSEGDAELISSAVTLENTAVAAYAAALESAKLDAATTKAVKTIKRQEQAHARSLAAALQRMGGTPPKSVDRALVKPLANAESQRDIATFAIELETMAVAAYYAAHGKLKSAKLLRLATTIMANEGQHLVVLRQALKQDPFPHAFETGQK